MSGGTSDLNAGTGVNYSDLDAFKVYAQRAAATTDINIDRLAMSVPSWVRGESAFLVRFGHQYIGFVVEGLGTKIEVADAWLKETGVSHHDWIGQCNLATMINDLSAVAVMPVVAGMFSAIGDAKYLNNELRRAKLIEGQRRACDLSGCVWGPGETQELGHLVNAESMVLGGAAWGVTFGNKLFNPERIRHGDVIIVFHSSGIHANGLTKARQIASELPRGYLTEVPGTEGKRYGELLLSPTHIYAPIIEQCLRQNVDVHYAIDVTGHGWRKLMRATGSFAYIIHSLPPELPIFSFIQAESDRVGPRLTDEQMYASFNMGAGFALIVPPDAAESVHSIVYDHRNVLGIGAMTVGYVGESTDGKHVIIEPNGVHFRNDSLSVR